MALPPGDTPPRRSAAEQFGRMAARYRTSRTHAGPGHLLDLGAMVSGRRYGTAVDVGSGPGFTAFAVAPFCERVIAVDVAGPMLEQVRELSAERGIRGVEPMLAAAGSLPFADGSVDLVICRSAAHHFVDVPRWLAESHRVLAAGGVLAIADTIAPAGAEAAAWMHGIERERDPSHVRNLPAAEWRASVAHAGFRIVREAASVVSLQFPDWAERAGMEGDALEALRARLLSAPADVKRASGIEPHDDGSIDFHWDVLALTAEKT